MDNLVKNPRFVGVYDVVSKHVYVGKPKSLKYLADNLASENSNLRHENVVLKLVLDMIVEDLEKEANKKEPIIIRKDYVEWIKKETKIEEAFK